MNRYENASPKTAETSGMSAYRGKILHQSRVIQRRDYSLTTTLCGRLSNRVAVGSNIADGDEKVTCKFCLRLIAKGGAA